MEKLTKEKKIRVINEIKPKRAKKINVQSNHVIIRYDLYNIHVDFDQ